MEREYQSPGPPTLHARWGTVRGDGTRLPLIRPSLSLPAGQPAPAVGAVCVAAYRGGPVAR